METIFTILNQPVVITLIAGVLLWALNKVYAKKPAWQAFEGSIITGIKWAEKQIPDDSENKSVMKLNAALQYVLNVYKHTEGKRASKAVEAELREGIQIIHAELEGQGSLPVSAEIKE
ncbi:MAG: hypothetical protein M0P93_08890 [Candidatus Cloacimonetes bacterium]|nr:hypothetical protein [Candidatus Cloacimonadota bacterium]